MYIYFGLAAIAILVLALSIFAKNTAIFRMFFPGIHEPFDPEDLLVKDPEDKDPEDKDPEDKDPEVKDLLAPEQKTHKQNNSIP